VSGDTNVDNLLAPLIESLSSKGIYGAPNVLIGRDRLFPLIEQTSDPMSERCIFNPEGLPVMVNIDRRE